MLTVAEEVVVARDRDAAVRGMRSREISLSIVDMIVLELEVYELLEVGRHELVDDEDDEDYGEGHEWEWHGSEAESVSSFEAVGEPVDNHSECEYDEYGGVGGYYFGDLRDIPG